MVRFEDEELNGDEKDTVQSLKARQLDNLTSKVIHEKSSKVVSSHDAGSRSLRSNSVDRLNNIGSLTLRELKNLKSESRRISASQITASPVSSPIKFKSTFPIDQPISQSNHFNTFPSRRKKVNTFPIDKECCDLNEPCDDHEDFDYLYDGSDDFMQTNYSNNIVKNKVPLTISSGHAKQCPIYAYKAHYCFFG